MIQDQATPPRAQEKGSEGLDPKGSRLEKSVDKRGVGMCAYVPGKGSFAFFI